MTVSDPGSAADKPEGTFYVLEDEPTPTRPRWYCHWDGREAPGFGTPEEAVAWGLIRARTVIVRTLDTVFYWAGERPSGWDDELRPWPPSAAERRQIDADYNSALNDAHERKQARGRYEIEREQWLAANTSASAGRGPAHTCFVLLPKGHDTGPEDIELEEFASNGVCSGYHPASRRSAFGTDGEVIASLSGRGLDDPWVRAVCSALARERRWTSIGRRSMLLVKQGVGVMFHATASGNRESIRQHGLDWRRMGVAGGIAGSVQPELPGIFLCASRAEAHFFTAMAREPSDIWEVSVDGLWLEGDPGASGGGDEIWMIPPEPVGPERLRLLDTDVEPGRERPHGNGQRRL